ncbi:DUF6268 family outer membrane beta-barrel protein [Parabacteroides sp.]
MRRLLLIGFMAGLIGGLPVTAQLYLRTDYITSSSFWDETNRKTGGSGGAKLIQGGFNAPIYLKTDKNNRPKMWGIGGGISYMNMNNKQLASHIDLSCIFNAQIALTHLRPISEKWSLLASLGIGMYTDGGKFSKYSFNDLLGQGAVVMIWHLAKNLDLGMGIALNTTFGYPMAFPAICLDWNLEGRFLVNVSMMDGMEISAGIRFNDRFQLRLVGEMNGSLAMVKRNGKKQMFTQQYVTTGLRPEFAISKSLSIPVTIGISPYRAAYYQDRSLKAFFKTMDREYDPHFSLAFHLSAAIKYGF